MTDVVLCQYSHTLIFTKINFHEVKQWHFTKINFHDGSIFKFLRVDLFSRIQNFKLKNSMIKYFCEWKKVKILITKHFFFNLSNNFSAKIMSSNNLFS